MKICDEEYWKRVTVNKGKCWGWTGSTNSFGHGRLRENIKTTWVYGHRYSWELHRGPIPEGLCVLHSCDNPPCSNPDHLFLGTRGDNNRDSAKKGRRARGEKSGQAKLTEKQVLGLRTKIEKGVSPIQLSRDTGIPMATIYNIAQLKTWQHLGPLKYFRQEGAVGRPRKKEPVE